MKLNRAQSEALKCLRACGPCDYYDFRGGLTSRKTLDWLTKHGLVTTTTQTPRTWNITEAGRAALDGAL